MRYCDLTHFVVKILELVYRIEILGILFNSCCSIEIPQKQCAFVTLGQTFRLMLGTAYGKFN